MTNRRLAINEALRELMDEMARLDALLGLDRAGDTWLIIKRALIAEHHKGELAAKGEMEATRLAYDSEELELNYGKGGD